MSELLFTQGRMGPMTLKNRAVRSATNEHLSEPDGAFTQAWAQAQIQLACHEVGLVITGHLCVDRTQRADEGQPVLDGETDIAFLRQAAEGVHQYGGRLAAQLSHSGPKAMERVNGRPAKSPADFSEEELDTLVEQFVLSARLCQQAGLDGVQIHNAHGYLLSSFLDPEKNRRTDEYGGSLENRFRLSERILRAVRQACGPDFALLVKADANACGDLHGLLKLYESCGVDGVEISGVDFFARPGVKEAFYLDDLLKAREGVELPLMLVGGIFSRDEAERVLEAGIPFVSFSRSLICQPDFIARMKAGEQEESACLACNGCFKVYRQRPVRCVQHTHPVGQLEKVFFST